MEGHHVMDVEEAIRTRHSVKVFSSEPVTPGLITQCLDLAIWAPNHRLTEPWHFTVVQGDALVQFSDLVYHILSVSRSSSGKALSEKRKYLSAPVLVAVYTAIDPSSETITRENYASTAAATQNMLLAAHNQGLGAVWRTSPVLENLSVRSFLQIPEPAQSVGLVFLGYSAQRAVTRRRTPAAQKTLWMGNPQNTEVMPLIKNTASDDPL